MMIARIKELIDSDTYVKKRYNISSTYGLIRCSCEISMTKLKKMSRLSDLIIDLGDDLYFIKFAYTNMEDSFKAAQNMIHYASHENALIHISLTQLNERNEITVLVNELEITMHELALLPESSVEVFKHIQ